MTTPADLLNAAIQHHQAGRLLEAEQLYQQVLAQQPPQARVVYLLGLANHQRGNWAAAVQWYQQAIALQPDYGDAHNNLGVLFVQQGNLTAAAEHYRAALASQPQNAHAHANLGVILQQLGQVDAAIAQYQQAIQLNPTLATAHTNLGHALKELGQGDAAIAHYETARQLMPTNPDAYRDLGDALQEQGRFQEALDVYGRAIAFAPDHAELNGGRIRTLLISGNLVAGFAAYDRWRLPLSNHSRSRTLPHWTGESLRGQPIVLYTEPGAGFGDSIQFVRYVPLVAKFGGQVIVECPAALVRLFQTMPAVTQVIATGDPLPTGCVQASLLSLPHILGTSLETIPRTIPYLCASLPDRDRELPRSPTAQRTVGLVWGGSPSHLHDRDRSCPFTQLQPLLATPHVQFYSLQKGAHQAELTDARVIDLGDRLQDFADTASVIQQLDLVITVDTAIAHLAGALGKPVWILLSYAADWRWLMHRCDSPWYPTARLFRQARRQDWAGVVQEVAIALDEWRRG